MYLRILVISCLLSLPVSAQKEGNIWYFGNWAGLDFNTSPPTPLTNSAMTTQEGCASICNRSGQLLFYTDGSTIYNKSHNTMTNGTGLTGHASSTQSAIVVQNPDSGHIYYVFTTFSTLSYSVVDTSLSGGLGAVRTKNVTLLNPGTEKLTAVRHSNGRDVWIVSHEGGGSNNFYVYLVTGAGVNTTPVVSGVGPNVSGGSLGVIKLAANGRTMAFLDYNLGSNSVQLLDFDNRNGTISNPLTLLSSTGYYGAEFSPTGRYLYVARLAGELNQFDVQAGSSTAIINSRKVIASNASQAGSPGTLQLASDGRIYVAQHAQTYVSVINFPDRPDTACRYILNAVGLSGKMCRLGLPTFNQSFFANTKVKVKYTCYTDTTLLSLEDTTGVDSLVWFFRDTASSHKVSYSKEAGHLYSQQGTYLGRVYVYRRITPYLDSADFDVVIKPLPNVSIGSDRTICKGVGIVITASNYIGNPASVITWDHGLGTGTTKLIAPPVTTTYRIIGDAGCTHYKDTDEMTVYVRPPVDTRLPADTTICYGDSILLEPVTSGGDSSYTHTWNNALGTGSSKKVSPVTPTIYRVVADDGCTPLKDTDFIAVYVRPPLDVTLRKDTTICIGNSVDLQPVAKGGDSTYTFIWNNGLGTGTVKTVSPAVTTTYRVILDDGCTIKKDTATVTIFVRPPLDIDFTKDTTICTGQPPVELAPVIKGGDSTYTITWDNGLGTGTKKTVSPSFTTIYGVILSDGCTVASDTDYITVTVRPPLAVIAQHDTILCYGQEADITAIAQGGRESTWQYDWDNSLGQGAVKHIIPADTVTYRVILSDGCTPKTDTAFVTVGIRPALEIKANNDTLICEGKPVNLKASGKYGRTGQHVFTWDNGLGTGSAKTVIPPVTTTYTVTLSDGCSPDVQETVVINVENLPDLQFFADSSLCEGELVSFNNTGSGSYQYTWRFGDGGSSLLEDPDHVYKKQGVYTVTLVVRSGTLGCMDSLVKPAYIKVSPTLQAAFKTNPAAADVEYPYVNFINQSSGAVNYQWNFGDNTTSSDVNPYHTYADTGHYPVMLVAASKDGCYDTATVLFRVKDIYRFYLPESFSPNGDGVNEEFRYVGRGYIAVRMKVYDRWGELVFETDKPEHFWNGGINNTGGVLPEGVYTYTLTVRDVSKMVHEYKGTVTIVK